MKYILFLLIFLISCSNNKLDENVIYAIGDKEEVENVVSKEFNKIYSILDIENEGYISYMIKDTMYVGEMNVVNMTISHGTEIDKIIEEIETFDIYLHSEIVRISPIMRARLIDVTGGYFNIIPITSEEQFLELNDYTLWKWYVIPLKTGEFKISIIVEIIIDNKSKTIKTYDDFIFVYSKESFIVKSWNFFKNNWQWFLSTLIIPFLIFIYRKKNKII